VKILAIETSCDETAAAVIENGKKLLSNVVVTQIDIHKEFGGVVPEIAARSHLEVVNPVIIRALNEAYCSWNDIDAIAVTNAPGLSGSLLVGTLTARTLAILHDKPLYPIHHVEAHVYANFITEQTNNLSLNLPSSQPTFPMLALIVSGGHSQLVLFQNHGEYTLLGQTQDDAVGEAFDKVAKILGLPYPGGPSIADAATLGDSSSYTFPKAKLTNPYDFSFSGLKTAVLRAVQRDVGKDFTFPSHELSGLLTSSQRHNFAASFQKVAVETLVDKTALAFSRENPSSIVIAGGVAANQELRYQLSDRIPIPIEYAPIQLCTDNAAMVGALAYFKSLSLPPTDPRNVTISPSLSMTKTAWTN
jgi:N6-L-threonylcarbamoyladenine synthase